MLVCSAAEICGNGCSQISLTFESNVSVLDLTKSRAFSSFETLWMIFEVVVWFSHVPVTEL
jgi:hypothetical protein